MAQSICATCRFYTPNGCGSGYCSCHDKTVSHGGSCCDYEED